MQNIGYKIQRKWTGRSDVVAIVIKMILWLWNKAFSAECVIHYSVSRQDNLERAWKAALEYRFNA
jgi:hypothetical protein